MLENFVQCVFDLFRVRFMMIYVVLSIFQPYRDLETGANHSLKSKQWDRESNPGPLNHLLNTTPPLLPQCVFEGSQATHSLEHCSKGMEIVFWKWIGLLCQYMYCKNWTVWNFILNCYRYNPNQFFSLVYMVRYNANSEIWNSEKWIWSIRSFLLLPDSES